MKFLFKNIQTLKQMVSIQMAFILLFTVQLQAQNPSISQADWKLKSEQDGLAIYTRSSDKSDIKDVRITNTFPVSAQKLEEVLNDVSTYKDWIYKCKDASLLQSTHLKEYYFYVEYDFPFPVPDRDIIIHTKRSTDDATGQIFYHSTAHPTYLAEKRKRVRIKEMTSQWILTPQADGTTVIEYIVSTSVGGKIPDWMVNMGVVSGPKKTMVNLGKVLTQDQQLLVQHVE